MKKALSIIIILAVSTSSLAQVSVSDSLKKHYLNTYEQSIKYADLDLAINSLNNVIVESNGNQGLVYKDTLSMLYFNKKDYYSSLLLSQEVYKADPANIKALARTGECFQAGKDFKNAEAAFETVAKSLKSPYYIYQLAVCQYSLKKFTECLANADKALADTLSNNIPVIFVLANGNEQKVRLSAAALNLKAVMLMDSKNFEQAKQILQNALKINPGFQGAQQNLEVCEKNAKGIKPTGKTNAGNKPKG